MALISLLTALPMVSMAAPYYRNSMTNFPLIGTVPVLSSRAPIHWYLMNSGLGDKELPAVLPRETSRQWYALGRSIYDRIKDKTAPDKAIKFGLRTYPLNGNTVMMFNWLESDRFLPLDQAPPFPGTVADYDAWIKSNPSCVLLSADGTQGDFLPSVDPVALEQAAQNAGFAVYDSVFTPNGREIKLWSRPCS